MMARFSAIVRVGSMRWPSGVVTGTAVALALGACRVGSAAPNVPSVECFMPPRLLQSFTHRTPVPSRLDVCPAAVRCRPPRCSGAYRSGRCRHPRPNGCTIGVILVQTVCHPSRRWQRDSSTRASKKSTSWTTLLSCPHDPGYATAEQWLEAARTAHGSALPLSALRAISVTAKSQGMSRWR